ncbi:hypothetical protein [Roseivivax sp. THAF197b]|uniref:hypothetical protein n=1 Tax=Roseivivax sp. THAF197b TaxID=2588299 RepID=UPI001268BC3F|nr:hypothetical protein [Roseivivax sp. THAF197b]QFS83972.1 hypothetical protein FIV09_14140 [Roseivivax sp. THAF197b]
MTVRVLFYVAPGDWRDRAIRSATGSIYSHCEMVAPEERGHVVEVIGASKRDGNQVRMTRIDLSRGRWHQLEYPGDEIAAFQRVSGLLGQPYDTLGALLSATRWARSRPGRWFCSELVAHALGFREPHEFSPGMLAAAALH